MYEEIFGHFGLARNPFLVSPDPENFYSTAAHDEALLQLVSRIEARQGLMVLTGEAGTGKTIVLRYLLDWLRKYNYSTAYVFHPLLRSADLLELILQDFGIVCVSTRKKDLRIALKNWLIDRHKAGECPVILIDEAQALKLQALAELRALLNLQVEGVRLVQVVLVGQPSLEERLGQQNFASAVRVMYECKLPALSAGETAGYICSRLSVAGAVDAGLIPEASVSDIYRYSKGIPRVINLLCEHAFLAAYADRRKSISPEDVLRVAQYFDLCGAAASTAETAPSVTYCGLIPFPRAESALVEPRDGAAVAVAEAAVALELEPQMAIEETSSDAVVTVPFLAEPVPDPHLLDSAQSSVAVASEQAAEFAVAVLEDAPSVPETASELLEQVVVSHVWNLLPEFAASANSARTETSVRAQVEVEAALIPEAEANVEVAEGVAEQEPGALELVTAVIEERGETAAEPVMAMVAVEPATAADPTPEIAEPFVACEPIPLEPLASPQAPEPPTAAPVAAVAPMPVAAVTPLPLAVAKPRPTPVVGASCKTRAVPVARFVLIDVAKVRASVTKFAASRSRVAFEVVARVTKSFVGYWRAVGRSLVRDSSALARECSIWLQQPVDRKGISALSRRAILAASAWLRHPIH
jgi:general secretion pathway protein A